MKQVLVDSGPIVAFLNRNDHYNKWAVAQLAVLRPPLFTCESVLSECVFLLQHLPGGRKNLAELLNRGLLKVAFHLQDELERVVFLLTRYADTPISLADACLIRMTEISRDSMVLTTDSDFKFYRRNGRQIIPTSMPQGES